MRFELPGYDVNYRDDEHHNTPAGKKIAELNRFLRENGIKGGIACLDEKGQLVRRYTDRVVLEIDDSTPSEKLEKVKKMVSDLLRVMGATESQIADVFNDEENNNGEKVKGVNNMGNYEREKFNSMKKKLTSLIETMDIIGEYSTKADELGIYVKKDFTFDEIYRTGGFDYTHGQVDFEDLKNKFMGYSNRLQTSVLEAGKHSKNKHMQNMTNYEREKLGLMKKKISSLVKTMDIIGEYSAKADELGIYVKKDFTFDEIYRTGGFDYTHGQVDFEDLRNKFTGYGYKLQVAVNKKAA